MTGTDKSFYLLFWGFTFHVWFGWKSSIFHRSQGVSPICIFWVTSFVFFLSTFRTRRLVLWLVLWLVLRGNTVYLLFYTQRFFDFRVLGIMDLSFDAAIVSASLFIGDLSECQYAVTLQYNTHTSITWLEGLRANRSFRFNGWRKADFNWSKAIVFWDWEPLPQLNLDRRSH